MKTRLWITMVASMVALAMGSMDIAFGRGGGGGGRGGGGGGGRPSGGGGGGGFSGGGGARPSVGSSPSFHQPSNVGGGARPSLPSAGPGAGRGARPSTGGGIGGANRPSVQPGSRPDIGAGAGSRPSTLPGTRPGGGSVPGIGSGQGVANRPGGTTINNNRVGVSQQPARLPGLGAGAAGSRFPNQGAGVQDRMANRPQTVEGRRDSLNNRMSSGREDWQNHRQDMQGDRQDWRSGNREDWQNFAADHQGQHGDWYHGCWNGGWYPGAGWNHMWDEHPAAAAFGLTVWGVNRLAYGFGYWGYSNPYSTGSSGGYDYSQPLVDYSATESAAAPTDPAAAPSESNDPGMIAFNDARTAFYNGDSGKALTLLDTALKTLPNDTVVHEFRSLVLFSLKKYPESAAGIYAVLSAGPGWDWTTMSSLYARVEIYTQQLRDLEDFAKLNPKSADAHFLLGYHYLTNGYAENAAKQFKLAQAQLPNDKLLTQLVGMTTPPDESKKSDSALPPEVPAVPPEKVLTAEKLVGSWKASSQGASFQLDLAKDGGFVWTYSRGKEKQSVKGVFAVDQNNLALETDDGGGTMLAEIDFTNPAQFLFKMIGGEEKDPGLEFKKS